MKKLDTGTGFGEQKINRYTTGMATLYKIKKTGTGTMYGVPHFSL